MSRETSAAGELEFLQALMKRGFVNIPRVLFDYTADLGLDYDTVGRMFVILACVGGPAEAAFGSYTISRKANPVDFDQLKLHVLDLEQKDIVISEEAGDSVTFSFIPLFSRLRAIWDQYREHYESELAVGASDPGLLSAERALGRPLSDREVTDIQDWMAAFHFESNMIQAIIREGQRQGVTRMSYLNQIARQWFEEGIRTPEEAEASIQRHRRSAGKHKSIMQYLGLKRQLTGAEQALLDKWVDEWGFSNEVIIRACAEATGSQNPLQYINRVLESWVDRGVKTVSDVEQIMTDHKRRASNVDAARGNKPQRKAPAKSNVFLQREKKDDDKYYDHIYKKLDD